MFTKNKKKAGTNLKIGARNRAGLRKLFPDINLAEGSSRYKEMGGGGIVYPEATSRLMDILKQPSHDQRLDNKLLHNSRVFDYFHDP